jgi:hypothetical protein
MHYDRSGCRRSRCAGLIHLNVQVAGVFGALLRVFAQAAAQ